MTLVVHNRLKFSVLFLAAALMAGTVSCAKKPADSDSSSASETPPGDGNQAPVTTTKHFLYISAGSCYSGTGNTTFTAATASNVVFKYDLDAGHVTVLADYNNSAAGTSPAGITEMDADHIGVLIENGTATGARRIEKISKADGAVSTYYSYSSLNGNNVFSGIVRAFDYLASEGSFLISRSTAIEKVSSTPNRQLFSGNAWVNAPAGACASTATVVSDVARSPLGHVLYTHANASQNKLVVTSKDGANASGGCLTAQAAPVATAFPTSLVYVPGSNQVLVSYAGNTTANDINSIYAYDYSETASSATISNATRAYQDANVLYGTSAMAYDKDGNNLYVATANSTATTVAGYNIEKFSYNPTTKTLTKVGVPPLLSHFWATKCISGLIYGTETETQ